MRPNEAFKIGFMARCVEEGLSPEATQSLVKSATEQVVKRGGFSLTGAMKNISEAARNTVQAAGPIAYPVGALALAAPPLLGGTAAYFANKATDTDADDIEEIKKRELSDTYRRLSAQLQRRKKFRDSKLAQGNNQQVYL